MCYILILKEKRKKKILRQLSVKLCPRLSVSVCECCLYILFVLIAYRVFVCPSLEF